MQKKFISNLALMVLLNLLIKPIFIFGVDAAVQNRVGAEEYGFYFTLLNFSFLFNILLDFGITNYTTKQVAQYPLVALKYLGKVMTFRIVLFFLYAIVSFGLALLLGWEGRALKILSLLVFNQFLVTLIFYIRGHLGGLLLFKSEAVVGVLDRFLLIALCGLALYTPYTTFDITIEWFILMQTICYGLTLIVGLIILFRKIGIPTLSYNPTFSYAVIRKSIPYALLILLMMIYTRIDSVMIERIHVNGRSESGYYAQGFRLINTLFIFAMIFSSLLYPIFSKMFMNRSNVVPLLTMAGKLLIGGSLGLAIITMYNSEYILSLIYTNDIQFSSTPFVWLMFGFIGMCSSIVFGTLLTARGNLKFLNITALIGIIINVSVNAYLIPKYGAYGAAIATVITQTLVSVTQIVYSLKLLKIQFFNWAILQLMLFIAGILIIGHYVIVDSPVKLFAVFIAVPILMVLFRLIDIKKLRDAITSEAKEMKSS